MNDIMTDLLNTVDVKISANSRSFNVDVHCYEHCSTEKIDIVIQEDLFSSKNIFPEFSITGYLA